MNELLLHKKKNLNELNKYSMFLKAPDTKECILLFVVQSLSCVQLFVTPHWVYNIHIYKFRIRKDQSGGFQGREKESDK